MKKEFVVNEISASSDGAPYVLMSLKDPKDMSGLQRPTAQQLGVFTSVEDMAKSIGRMFTLGLGGAVTTIKLTLREYEELNVKVGDRLVLEISKTEIVNP